MGSRHNVKDEVINKLAAAVSIKMDQLNVAQLLSVVASLTNLRYPHNDINMNLVDRVVRECLDKVTAPGVVLPENTTFNFVISLITYSSDRRVSYHKGLFEMFANLIVNNQDKIEIYRACAALWALTKHSHVHYGLLDYVAEQIASKNRKLITNEKLSFVNILAAFSLPSNYKPNKPNSDVIFETILQTPHINLCRQRSSHLLFRIMKYLSISNFYSHNFIKDCINKYLDDAVASSTINGSRLDMLHNLVLIYQGLCLEFSDSSHDDICQLKLKLKPFVDELIGLQSKEFKDKLQSESLQRSIEQGLGGPQFVTNNLFSEFGHFIDHVVVMRKGGYPIAIGERQNITCIKDLELPPDCKMYSILSPILSIQ